MLEFDDDYLDFTIIYIIFFLINKFFSLKINRIKVEDFNIIIKEKKKQVILQKYIYNYDTYSTYIIFLLDYINYLSFDYR